MRIIASYLFVIIILFIAFFFASCSQQVNDGNEQVTHNQVDTQDPLVKVNRYLVKKEEIEINDLVRRYGWKMEVSKSGLRSMIYVQGVGEPVVRGKLVTIRYEVKLIDGTLVYSSEQDGLKQFTVGKGGIESGIEEGILLLKVGDRAKFILPSHLAFGLLGDDRQIPPKSTLIYDIEVVDLY
jgi:FKBP-type peptidyl-prolyl cis-trans isomerase FkpA